MQLGGMDVSSYKYLYCAAVTYFVGGGGGVIFIGLFQLIRMWRKVD